MDAVIIPQGSRQLHCVVCLEYPTDAVSCSSCHKMLCFSHLPKLAQRCPHCRQHPLTLVCEYELQGKMDKLKSQERREARESGKRFKCTIKSCEFQGCWEEMDGHREKRHPELMIEFVVYGEEPKEVFNPTRAEKITQQYALKPRTNTLPPGHKSKIPTKVQAWTMARHVNTCRDAKCYEVWTGNWGSFIGGEMGETHFDLTLCERGRRLNEQVGWDYTDPRI